MRENTKRIAWIGIAVLLGVGGCGGAATDPEPSRPAVSTPTADVGIEPQLDGQVPLDVSFRDEAGRAVRLGELIDGKPVIMSVV
jgi:protein SCO1/2